MELPILFHGSSLLQILMEEVDLWEHVEKEIPEPTNPTQLATHRKKEAKVKRIILDSMKDHFIPHISIRIQVRACLMLWLSYFKILVLLNSCSCKTNSHPFT
jgi:hypothetical protein